ncbi:acyltransferase family protein, partial [Ilumatobacter sp.]|uniref:acyltransferase family protein n=1 Tax=Ilumatobacter sp. TaxID=1967498 RepID=UPI003C5D5ADD
MNTGEAVDDGSARRFDHVRELDGLRGIAVAAVVVYHLWPDVLPGGFIGVDVFFVLSGFLLSALLVHEAERTGRVGFGAFMVRRVRRLLPATLLVLGAIALYAATWANDVELARLRRHVFGSLTYSINWLFIADGTTYTDVVAGASPLRHVWSLAIEEQFYLMLAVVVAALVRLGGATHVRRRLILGGGILAGVSAVWMIALSLSGASLARTYFGTDTRMQAMLIGVAIGAWKGDELLGRRLPG